MAIHLGARLCLGLALASSADRPALSAETWETRGPMPGGYLYWTAAVIDERIFVFASSATDNATWELVPGPSAAQDAWIPRSPRPAPLVSYAKAGAIDGLVYLPGGGLGSSNSTGELAIYDPVADAWRLGPALPREVNNYALAVLDGGLYLTGGCCGNRADLFRFTPALGWVTEPASLPVARCSPGGAAALARFFAISGYDWPGTTRLDLVDAYDPVLGAWSSTTPLPGARDSHGAIACGARIYVVGGSEDGRLLDSVEVLDVASRTWSSGPVMPGSGGATAAVWRQGLIWVFPLSGGDVMVLHPEDPPGEVPGDQGNVLRCWKSGGDVQIRFAGAAAGAWRVYRDLDKTSIGRTALAPDAAVASWTDSGAVGDPSPYLYAIQGLSACSLTPGP